MKSEQAKNIILERPAMALALIPGAQELEPKDKALVVLAFQRGAMKAFELLQGRIELR